MHEALYIGIAVFLGFAGFALLVNGWPSFIHIEKHYHYNEQPNDKE